MQVYFLNITPKTLDSYIRMLMQGCWNTPYSQNLSLCLLQLSVRLIANLCKNVFKLGLTSESWFRFILITSHVSGYCYNATTSHVSGICHKMRQWVESCIKFLSYHQGWSTFCLSVGNECWNQYWMGIVDGKYLRGYRWRNSFTGSCIFP